MSHVAARQEVRDLVAALNLPRLGPAEDGPAAETPPEDSPVEKLEESQQS
jgi:hypothetical protein